MKIALLTIADENFREIADRTLPSMRRYADAFGLEFINMTPGVSDRPPSWGKVVRIREVLRSGFDYCLYVDADAVFVRFDADIRDYITATKDLYLCWHDQANSESYVAMPGHFNTGVAIYRHCTWSLDFLDEIWQQTDFISHKWWEQAALLHLLGYRGALETGPDEPDLARTAHVQHLPVDWNALVGYTIAPDPIIRHFAGRSNPRRLVDIDRELAFERIRMLLPPDARGFLAQQLNLIARQSQEAGDRVSQARQASEQQAADQIRIAQGEVHKVAHRLQIAQGRAEEAAEQMRIAKSQAEEAELERKAMEGRAEEAERQMKIAQRQAEQILAGYNALLRSPANLSSAWWRAVRGKGGVRD